MGQTGTTLESVRGYLPNRQVDQIRKHCTPTGGTRTTEIFCRGKFPAGRLVRPPGPTPLRGAVQVTFPASVSLPHDGELECITISPTAYAIRLCHIAPIWPRTLPKPLLCFHIWAAPAVTEVKRFEDLAVIKFLRLP
jgi:hypothetical protein